MTTHSIVVSAYATDRHNNFIATPDPRTEQIAQQTGLPIVTPKQLNKATFYLYWKANYLTLCDQSRANTVDVCVDFCSGKNKHRLHFGGSFGQPLARAISANPNSEQQVCDATGGLGQDAFVFATLGCNVVILERSRIIYSLLQDGLARAVNDEQMGSIVQRMSAYCLDSRQLPDSWPLSTRPETLYLDPMYPHTGKTAVAKKGMQTLQRLLSKEQSSHNEDRSLLSAAIATATKRVVVKRPAKASPFAGQTPVGSIKSPNTRYDLYNAQ